MRSYRLKLLFIIICVFATIFLRAQNNESIRWYTMDQLEALEKKEKRKIMIDVYTNWCGWCKYMDKTTFAQQYIAHYINENYYAVKLNAEQRESILFKNRTYKYVTQSNVGFNELAAELLNGQMSYPATIFLDENFNIIQTISGYLKSEQFEIIISYFGEDNYKKIPWTRYEKTYTPMKR
jgi:thioredoxin-related protein